MNFVIAMTNLATTGGKTVGRGILEGLAKNPGGHQYTVLFPAECGYEPLIEKLGAEGIRIGGPGGVHGSRWKIDQRVIPGLVKERRADGLLTLNSFGPWRPGCPHVVMIQFPYLAYPIRELEFPTSLAFKARMWVRDRWFGRMRGAIDDLIVQTPVMKQRMERRWGFDPARVHVVPPGVAIPSAAAVASVTLPKALASADRPFMIYPAAPFAHKNFAILPDAVAFAWESGVSWDLVLTLDENDPAIAPTLARAEALGVRARIRCIGAITHDETLAALRAARLLLMPTLLETFGLPYVEAMASGCPIATSDRDFAHTTCEDAAVYFNPLDPASIGRAIVALADEPKRVTLVAKGHELLERRFARQGWDEAARGCLQILETAADRWRPQRDSNPRLPP